MNIYKGGNLSLSVRSVDHLAIAAFILWLLVQIDAVFPRLQMLWFGGQVLLPFAVVKGLLSAILLIGLLIRPRLYVPGMLGLTVSCFAIYLTLEIIFLEPALPEVFDKLYSYYNYYFLLLLSPLAFTFWGTLSEKKIVRTLIVIFIPLAVLGITQQYLGQPLLSTQSSDEQFRVISWGYPGYVRGFSLFGSALGFGHYICLIAPLVLTLIFKKPSPRHKFIWLILLALTLWTTYATLTRLVFLWALAAILFALAFLLTKRKRRLLLYMPLLFGVIGVFVAVELPDLISQISTAPVLSDYTLRLRLDQWGTYLNSWLDGGNWYRLLFGAGYFQTSNVTLDTGVVIDNTYLAVASHIGLWGLVFYLLLLWQIWKYCFQSALVRNSPLTIAVASFVSAWMLAGIFNIEIESFILALMLCVWSYNPMNLRKRNPSSFRG